MDEYLMKYGFTPTNMGLDQYLRSNKIANDMRISKAEMAKGNHQNSTGHNYTPSRFDDVKLKDLPLAMAYVPMQWYEDCYAEEIALKMGTLFPELNKPFLGRKP